MRCTFKKQRLVTVGGSTLSAARPNSADAKGLALDSSTQTWVPATASALYDACLALGTLFNPSRLSFFTCRIERINGCS